MIATVVIVIVIVVDPRGEDTDAGCLVRSSLVAGLGHDVDARAKAVLGVAQGLAQNVQRLADLRDCAHAR